MKKPVFDKLRAVFHYTKESKRLIHNFKFSDKLTIANIFANWLQEYGKEIIKRSDLIIPVPLHPFRLIGRKYNQALILAEHISQKNDIPVITSALKRINIHNNNIF